MIISNAQIYTPGGVLPRGWLQIDGEHISAIGTGDPPSASGDVIDAEGKLLLPGFIDLHVHGGAGKEAMDAEADSLRQMGRFYAQHGVTGYLATTWTDSQERITAALEAIAANTGPQPDGATLLGAHLEGPYLNQAKSGAQNIDHIRRAGRDEATHWLDLDVIKLLALAPEYDENHWLISDCTARGITVSAAHTDATYAQMRQAVGLGLRQTTHTYNGMRGLHHREPGVLGAALTLPELRCELIADNIHVHPAAMKLLYQAKGAENVILISDAIRSAGMPDGDYPIDERVVTVKDGVVRLPDGTLAGSTLTMDRALFNFIQATGEPLEQLWPCSSLNAAAAIDLADQTGSLAAGKYADLVLAEPDIRVKMTIARGKIVFQED